MKATALLFTLLSVASAANAQLIISDTYEGSGTGFALGSGVNSGINPPETRLTGTAAANLRYVEMGNRGPALYTITDNKFHVNGGSAFAVATLSADGTTAFDFASVLGSSSATPSSPVTYDISISMANSLNGATPRFSLGIGTVEPLDGVGQAPNWDFGFQLHRNVSGGTAYSVSKRIDQDSGLGLLADDNTTIFTSADDVYGSEIDFVLRITDAGAESDSYNSRVQLSIDGGSSFLYDSLTDPAFSGFRFDGAGRYLTWDIAGNGSNGGFATYDNFSIVVVPEPSTFALAGLGGAALLFLRRRRSSW